MDNFGFIHDKLDIKILILYILEKLPGAVDPTILSDLALFDGGFTWFDYTDCLAELVQTEQVREENGKYEITEKGRRNVGYVGSGLPYSVRAKADRLTAPTVLAMQRARQIETVTEVQKDGGASVSLRLSDGVGEVIALRLAVPDEASGKSMEANFRKKAEKIYNQILTILTEE
ncbi:MAG: DUF4364 family protein [Oscillospiraceae bacterium]